MRAIHFLILFVLFLPGCVLIKLKDSGVSDAYSDAEIKSSIAYALLKKDPEGADSITVHCYDKHVYLIGEANRAFRLYAVNMAKATPSVKSVTEHWFPVGTREVNDDERLAADIEGKIIFADNIDSASMTTDVVGGNVVMTGFMKDKSSVEEVLKIAQTFPKVKSITSYIIYK